MTTEKRHRLRGLAVALLATAAFVSCFQNTAFFKYRHVDINGWERIDFLDYRIPAAETSGYYTEIIGVRAGSTYPFKTLTLIVEQNIISTVDMRRDLFKRDTLQVDIYDQDGLIGGTGVDLHQFEIPFKTIRLERGDSVYMTIRHHMSRRVIKGISDVGVRVYRP